MPNFEKLPEEGELLEVELDVIKQEVTKIVLEGGYRGPKLSTRAVVIGHTGSDGKFADYYREVLGAGEEVVGWIKSGYFPPLESWPETNQHTANNKSARDSPDFVEKELER